MSGKNEKLESRHQAHRPGISAGTERGGIREESLANSGRGMMTNLEKNLLKSIAANANRQHYPANRVSVSPAPLEFEDLGCEICISPDWEKAEISDDLCVFGKAKIFQLIRSGPCLQLGELHVDFTVKIKVIGDDRGRGFQQYCAEEIYLDICQLPDGITFDGEKFWVAKLPENTSWDLFSMEDK